MPGSVTVISHPLVQHKLSLLRQKQTGTRAFRSLLGEISLLLAYEVTRDLPLGEKPIETPLAAMQAPLLDGKPLVVISTLRAGDGMLEGMMQILPAAHVVHVGSDRDPPTLEAVEGSSELPRRDVLVVAPTLATGKRAILAVSRILALEPRSLKLVCLLAAPEGLASFHAAHPDVPVFTAAIDERLNDHGQIVPGLGDAEARLFGTK